MIECQRFGGFATQLTIAEYAQIPGLHIGGGQEQRLQSVAPAPGALAN